MFIEEEIGSSVKWIREESLFVDKLVFVISSFISVFYLIYWSACVILFNVDL